MSHDPSDAGEDSARFGLWPSFAGLAFAALIMVTMFTLATGFR